MLGFVMSPPTHAFAIRVPICFIASGTGTFSDSGAPEHVEALLGPLTRHLRVFRSMTRKSLPSWLCIGTVTFIELPSFVIVFTLQLGMRVPRCW